MTIPITGRTKLTCLLGYPVAHSISPMMHNKAFELCNLDYVYLAFPTVAGALPATVETLKNIGARGFNLTMPNKNAMADLCDELSDAARISHSVNTVVNDNGRLYGDTTDGRGFMKAAERAGFPVPGKKITLLGAGGAACSIFVQAALEKAAGISIFSRRSPSFLHAQELMQRLKNDSACDLRLFDYDDPSVLKNEIRESDILIQATNIGMAPDTNACLIPDASFFHNNLAVFDIIYNPAETKLLSLAKECGCPSCNGLSMLLYQGAEAFRLWTGREMPVDEVKASCFS